MAQSINLIPQAEKKAQEGVKVVKFSSILAVLLLLVVLVITGFMYYQQQQVKRVLEDYDQEIAALRTDITNMAEIEVVARNLDKKYRALETLLTTRVNYSKLAIEQQRRVPLGLFVEDFSMRDGTHISVSGIGNNYIVISTFLSNLSTPPVEIASSGLDELFTNVSLTSAGLESRVGGANYDITMDFNSGLLQEQNGSQK